MNVGQKAKVIKDQGCNFAKGQIVTFVGTNISRDDLLSFEGESINDGSIITQLLLEAEIEILDKW